MRVYEVLFHESVFEGRPVINVFIEHGRFLVSTPTEEGISVSRGHLRTLLAWQTRCFTTEPCTTEEEWMIYPIVSGPAHLTLGNTKVTQLVQDVGRSTARCVSRLTRTRRYGIVNIGAPPHPSPKSRKRRIIALLELGVLLGVLGWIVYLLRTAPPDPKSK